MFMVISINVDAMFDNIQRSFFCFDSEAHHEEHYVCLCPFDLNHLGSFSCKDCESHWKRLGEQPIIRQFAQRDVQY